MLWFLVGVFLLIWTAVSRWRNRKLIALGKILSTKSICLPIVGHAYQYLGSDEDIVIKSDKLGKEAYEKGGIVSVWEGHLFVIMVADPVIADVLLKTCSEKPDPVRMFKALLGNGNIFASVPIWRPRRKTLAPIFSQKNLNSFVEVFSEQSSIMVDQLSKVAGKGTFSVWKKLTTYNMHSVCETTLGVQLNTQLDTELPFLNHFENCCRIDAKRLLQPWFYNDTVNKIFNRKAFDSYTRSKEYIWKYMDKIIHTKWEDLKKEKQASESNQGNKKSWKTFLELLLESSAGYGKVELREETLVIVLAGTDTSAVGAGFTLLMLANHPDIQEKVYEEVQEIFGNSDRPVTREDLPRLNYLDAVIKESLRLYPPVPYIGRKVENDVTLRYQYAMMSIKTALSTLVRRYRVLPSESMNEMSKAQNDLSNSSSKCKLRVGFDIMMKHVNNFEIQLEMRT